MPNVRSVCNGSESILFLAPKICDIVLLELKELTSVVAFKKDIKEWKPYTIYVSNLGLFTVKLFS